MQIERLQQINFPEFITTNSQAIIPPSSSLGAACEKHSFQDLVCLESECQAGIYCPECTELCPFSVNTVIHHCQNCNEFYCLLCAHEYGYCLACEIEPSIQNDEPSRSSHVFADQPSGKASDIVSPVVSQPSLQFKAPLPPITQKRIRSEVNPILVVNVLNLFCLMMLPLFFALICIIVLCLRVA